MESEFSQTDARADNYVVAAKQRPDGSVLVTIAHQKQRLERIIESDFSAQELARAIKFDLAAARDEASLHNAVQRYARSKLPTYTNRPVHRTRTASLWAMRKIREI